LVPLGEIFQQYSSTNLSQLQWVLWVITMILS